MIDLDLMTAASLLQGMYWKRGMPHKVSVHRSMIMITHGVERVTVSPELAVFMAAILGEAEK